MNTSLHCNLFYISKSCLAYATHCFTKGHSRATLKVAKKKKAAC